MARDYFECLEDAFQSLTSAIQHELASSSQSLENKDQPQPRFPLSSPIIISSDSSYEVTANEEISSTRTATHLLSKLFERSRVVFERMYLEARRQPECFERLMLYRIQLQTLNQEYRDNQARKYQVYEEMTYEFDDYNEKVSVGEIMLSMLEEDYEKEYMIVENNAMFTIT